MEGERRGSIAAATLRSAAVTRCLATAFSSFFFVAFNVSCQRVQRETIEGEIRRETERERDANAPVSALRRARAKRRLTLRVTDGGDRICARCMEDAAAL